VSAVLGSVGADATDAKTAFGSDATPNVAFCLHVSNLAGNLLMYNSMMRIPAYCSHSVKALEVVITTILACGLQRRWVLGREIVGCVMISAGLFVCFTHSSGSHNGDRDIRVQPLCDMGSIGILEVLLAAVMLPARAYTRSLSAQLEPYLTHKNTLHTINTP
jgi:drug/metabolite transporter (DMT)-like permease